MITPSVKVGNLLRTGLLVFVLGFHSCAASASLSIIDENSPDFPMGKATRRGLLIQIPGSLDKSISIGARLQGTVEAQQADNAWAGDFYARRIRFEFGANLSRKLFYFMDFRNDQANNGDSGERGTVIGNTFFQFRELFDLPYLNVQAFRGKLDVSRVTTASSGQQIAYDRPLVAQSAQQYVSPNRRAPNLQLFGSYEGKIRYQLALGDGVASSSFFDAKGNTP
ncbi:hypothetical protein EBQ90_00030, partial [bacterium]|nr:hypothetical protein [bacterium]